MLTLDNPARVDQEFVRLVCHDPDLLDAEFEAIIAASWNDPPADPRPDHPGDREPQPHRPEDCICPVPPRSRGPGIDGFPRGRSPPRDPRQTTNTLIEARGR